MYSLYSPAGLTEEHGDQIQGVTRATNNRMSFGPWQVRRSGRRRTLWEHMSPQYIEHDGLDGTMTISIWTGLQRIRGNQRANAPKDQDRSQ